MDGEAEQALSHLQDYSGTYPNVPQLTVKDPVRTLHILEKNKEKKIHCRLHQLTNLEVESSCCEERRRD